MSSQHSPADSPSQVVPGFITGFSVGILAGAVAAYLFSTPQGKKARQRLAQEWKNAREVVAEESGVAAVADWEFKDVVSALGSAFRTALDGAPQKPSAKTHAEPTAEPEVAEEPKKSEEEPKPKKSKVTKPPAKPDAQKFRGV